MGLCNALEDLVRLWEVSVLPCAQEQRGPGAGDGHDRQHDGRWLSGLFHAFSLGARPYSVELADDFHRLCVIGSEVEFGASAGLAELIRSNQVVLPRKEGGAGQRRA